MKGTEAAAKSEDKTTEEWEDIIVESIHDLKGEEVLKLDMRNLDEAPCDYFIICSANSHTQVKSIADKIQENIKKVFGVSPNHVEGTQNAQWVLLDYFDFVIHVFYKETRQFYELESLWSDAKAVEYSIL